MAEDDFPLTLAKPMKTKKTKGENQMISIKKLAKPTKRSGYQLAGGETTEVRGLAITNLNKFSVFIDKFTKKKKKK